MTAVFNCTEPISDRSVKQDTKCVHVLMCSRLDSSLYRSGLRSLKIPVWDHKTPCFSAAGQFLFITGENILSVSISESELMQLVQQLWGEAENIWREGLISSPLSPPCSFDLFPTWISVTLQINTACLPVVYIVFHIVNVYFCAMIFIKFIGHFVHHLTPSAVWVLLEGSSWFQLFDICRIKTTWLSLRRKKIIVCVIIMWREPKSWNRQIAKILSLV